MFAFRPDTVLDPVRLMDFVRARPNVLRLRPDSKLVYTMTGGDPVMRLGRVRAFLKELEAVAGLVAA